MGASDGILANIGAGAFSGKTAAVTIRTSGAIRIPFDKPVLDDEGRVFCYILTEDKYIIGGEINNSGIVYNWFKNEFAEKNTYEILNNFVKDAPPGSNGMVFLPFLYGERAPYWNSNLKGAFLGIRF